MYSLGIDEFDNVIPGYYLRIHLSEYRIIKRTPKGAWIELFPSFGEERKFVLLTARKKFACETKEEALESFLARKTRQIRILEAQLTKARACLELIKTDKEKDYVYGGRLTSTRGKIK
jgi:hypothetical protein